MATTIAGTAGAAAVPVLTTTGYAYGSKGHMRIINLNKDSIKPLENQVGGHKTTDNGKPPYILRLGEDRLLKVCMCLCMHAYFCVCVVCMCMLNDKEDNGLPR